MAKVTGPLFSVEARGAVGKSLVFFPWLGRNVVRGYVIPSNPQSTNQGVVRVVLKTIAKAIHFCEVGSTIQAALQTAAGALTPWGAYIVGKFCDTMKTAGAIDPTKWSALVAEYEAAILPVDYWTTPAENLGIVGFSFGYGYTDEVPPGFILYVLAKAIYASGAIQEDPYNTNPSGWDGNDVSALVAALAAA